MKSLSFASLLAALVLASSLVIAAELEVKLNGSTASVTVPTNNGPVEITRNQDQNNTIDPAYSKTSRKCPPFCIQPMQVAPGVTTVGEMELLEFAKKGAN